MFQIYLLLIRIGLHLFLDIIMHFLSNITFFPAFFDQVSLHVDLNLSSFTDPLHHSLVLPFFVLFFLFRSWIVLALGLCVHDRRRDVRSGHVSLIGKGILSLLKLIFQKLLVFECIVRGRTFEGSWDKSWGWGERVLKFLKLVRNWRRKRWFWQIHGLFICFRTLLIFLLELIKFLPLQIIY